jgi:hypothetical protein
MIRTAEEFKKLRTSENLDEQRRAGDEQASIDTWQETIAKYPELKTWVIYNKTIPVEILNQLSKDPNPDIRSEVACKRKIDSEIFNRLRSDNDENVKYSLLCNTKLTKEQKSQIDTSGSMWFQREVFQKLKTASTEIREIELFGYNQNWIELGIINKEQIHEDLLEFKSDENCDPDLIRQSRLLTWLKNKKETNEAEIDRLCELAKNDIDISYANNVVTEFYNSIFVKEDQRILIEEKIKKLSPYLKGFVKQKKTYRALSINESPDD